MFNLQLINITTHCIDSIQTVQTTEEDTRQKLFNSLSSILDGFILLNNSQDKNRKMVDIFQTMQITNELNIDQELQMYNGNPTDYIMDKCSKFYFNGYVSSYGNIKKTHNYIDIIEFYYTLAFLQLIDNKKEMIKDTMSIPYRMVRAVLDNLYCIYNELIKINTHENFCTTTMIANNFETPKKAIGCGVLYLITSLQQNQIDAKEISRLKVIYNIIQKFLKLIQDQSQEITVSPQSIPQATIENINYCNEIQQSIHNTFDSHHTLYEAVIAYSQNKENN
jgi:hypothetical protein